MGKQTASKQYVTDYRFSMHLGLPRADSITAFYINEKLAWSGDSSTLETLQINQPQLFGGPQQEGGAVGNMTVLPGLPDQQLPDVLANKLSGKPGSETPGFRGFMSLFLTGMDQLTGFLWSTNNAAPIQSLWTTQVRKSVGLPDATAMIGVDSNPAHIIYEAMTATWGMNAPTTQFDYASWSAVAQTLYDEGFGLSLQWVLPTAIEDFVSEIIDHIQAYLFLSPKTGQWTLKLVRDDYDVDTIRQLSPSNGVLTSFKRLLWGETTNEISLTWTDGTAGQEKATIVTYQNLANAQQQGQIVHDDRNYYGIRNATLAATVVVREVRNASAPVASGEMTLDRSCWDIEPGEVCLLTWPEEDVADMVIRVGTVDYGKRNASSIKIDFVEDIFSLERPPVTPAPGSAWVNPSVPPAPVDDAQILTLPAYFASNNNLQTSAINLDYPEVLALILGHSDESDTSSYELFGDGTTSTGATGFIDHGSKTLVQRVTLNVNFAQEAQTELAAILTVGLTNGPVIGGFVFIGTGADADIEITQIVGQTNTGWTLARGVLDTVPRAWTAGTPVWFVNVGARLVDETEIRAAGETVDYKLLTRTSQGLLALTDALTETATMTARPHLPNRPANCQINGNGFGTFDASAVDTLHLTWGTRNRTLEDGIVYRWTDGTIAPEYGQGTTITILDQNGAQVFQQTSLWSETSFDVPKSWLAKYSAATIVFSSSRDGFDSLQNFALSVTGLPNDGGAALPPDPVDTGAPPSPDPAPDISFWSLAGSDTLLDGSGNVLSVIPAIVVSGKRDRTDAVALAIRYTLQGSADYTDVPEKTLDDSSVKVSTEANIHANTTYTVEIAYQSDKNILSLWATLGDIATPKAQIDGSSVLVNDSQTFDEIISTVNTIQGQIDDDTFQTSLDAAAAAASAAASLAAQNASETAASNAATAQSQAEAANDAAQSAVTAAQDAATGASGSESAAALSASTAQTAADNAAAANTLAQSAAVDAAASKTAADTSAASASDAASTAITQAGLASGSATAAAGSAATSSSQADAAAGSASAAAGSATTASTEAGNASVSAGEAASSSSTAQSAATTATTQAGLAGGSASAAATSATEAGVSETNAGESAFSAATQATAAQTAAGDSAVSAGQSATSASDAAGSASSASTSASTAATASSAADAALQAQGRQNLLARANAAPYGGSTGAVDIAWGQSGWGAHLIGSGSIANGSEANAGLVIQGLAPITPNAPYSTSFRAKILAGDSTAYVLIDWQPDSLADIGYIEIGSADQTYTFPNIVTSGPDTAVAYWRIVFFIEAGTVVEITDLKLEQGDTCTNWTPSPKDARDYTNAAATSATSAAASNTAAGDFAASAETSATTATTQAGNASTFASQASTSASDAAGSSNTASEQAGISATQAGLASGSAGAAADSASTAQTAATSAGQSASSASTASVSAQLAALTQFPAKISDATLWTSNDFQLPPSDPYDPSYFVTASDGTSVWTNRSQQQIVLATRATFTPLAGRVYQVIWKWRRTRDVSNGRQSAAYPGFSLVDSAGVNSGVLITFDMTLPPLNEWQTTPIVWDLRTTIPGTGVYAYARPRFHCNWDQESGLNPSDALYEVGGLSFDDVTDGTISQEQASAASTSASQASVSAGAAGTSASSASESANTASTQAGDASTFASQAANSASTADTAANTATTQAGISTDSANLASGFSTSASGFASNAATSATDAGNSATSAHGFSDTAASQAADAATSAGAASTSASGAATSASDAGVASSAAQSSSVSAHAAMATSYPSAMNSATAWSTNIGLSQAVSTDNFYPDSYFSTGSFLSVGGSQFYVAQLSSFAPVVGHTYAVTLVWTKITQAAGAVTSQIGPWITYAANIGGSEGYNADDIDGNSVPTGVQQTTVYNWQCPAGIGAARAWVRINWNQDTGPTSDNVYSIASLGWVDITSQLDAGAAATAAATSASNAAASETAAGESASSSASQATDAATSAGSASTFASEASTSATDAAGSASTASTQAGISSNSATNANTSAGLASGSATDASNSAGLASGSATAAAGSASTASTDATGAATSATDASNSASTASGQAGDAADSATAAATSAAASSSDAAAAQTSATLSASLGYSTLNFNPAFSSYSSAADLTPPDEWNVWVEPLTMGRTSGKVSPWAVFMNTTNNGAGAATNCGIYQSAVGGLVSPAAGYYVMELDFNLVAGGLGGLGLYCYDTAAGGIGNALSCWASKDINGTVNNGGVAGRDYSYRLLVYYPTIGANFTFHMMLAWDGFGDPMQEKIIKLYRAGIRPASSAEIAGNQALADSATNAASITSLSGVVTSNESSQATTNTTLQAQLNVTPNLIPSMEAGISGWFTPVGIMYSTDGVWGANVATFGAGVYAAMATPTFAAQEGVTYAGSADFGYFGGSGDFAYMNFEWFDGSGNLISYPTAATALCTANTDFSDSRARSTFSVTQVAPTGAAHGRLRWVVSAQNGAPTFAGWRRVKVERGNVVTPYTTEAGLSSLSASVSVQAGTLATVQGRVAAYWNLEVDAGTGQAFIKANADGVSTSIAMAADVIAMYNSSNGALVPAMALSGGNAYFPGVIYVGSSGQVQIDGTTQTIRVYDNNGVLRVRMGLW